MPVAERLGEKTQREKLNLGPEMLVNMLEQNVLVTSLRTSL